MSYLDLVLRIPFGLLLLALPRLALPGNRLPVTGLRSKKSSVVMLLAVSSSATEGGAEDDVVTEVSSFWRT